jgi:hypothetical protein
MGFRHLPLGIPSRNVVQSGSRLVLSVLAGSEALGGDAAPGKPAAGKRPSR